MIVATRVRPERMANIPTHRQQTFPLSLLTVLLHAKKPMASRMKGRRKGIHCHSREDRKIVSIHSLSATQDCHTTVIINLTATRPLLRSYKPSTALCDLHLASYAPNHPKGTFACAEAKASRYAPQIPYGNLAVKRSDFYTDFSRNPFVLQKRDRVFAIPKVSRATRRLADHVRLYKLNSIHPFNLSSLI